jgi:hypothetical protein
MLRENNNNFVMTRPYGYQRFSFIQQVRITRIRLVANYEILFRRFLHDAISHITTDYDFSFGAFDTRRNDPVDTVGYLICRYNDDNFKCLKALDGVECLGKYLACKPNLFTNHLENHSFIVNSQEQRDMVVKFNDAWYRDCNINHVIITQPLPPRRTLADQLRLERAENERILNERRRLENAVQQQSRNLQDRLSFNNTRVVTPVIKIETDTDESDDGFSYAYERSSLISGKRKSTRLEDEPPSKVQAANEQGSSAAYNTGVQRVLTQHHIDIAHEVITSIIDKVVEQVRVEHERKVKLEADKTKWAEISRMRRTMQYGPMAKDTAQELLAEKNKSSEKATQTRDSIHKSTSF